MSRSFDEISGSWYPTGFHGHFRSKTRNDFNIPYRQRAKPQPPQKFLNLSRERSNRHMFSRHDNRHAHSNMGDLEAFFNMGLGKRKYLTSGSVATQHTKNTRELITWRGNESDTMVTTYRTHFDKSSSSTRGWNETEPLHVRSNLHLQRRQLRAASAPPCQQRTRPSLLAWNEPDETYDARPGVGLRTQMSQEVPNTLPRSAPATTNNYTVSETVTPLNTK